MSNLFASAASGLASGWRGTAGSTESQATPGAVQDLTDPKQVGVFDALKELSRLKVTSTIEIPQLIVVGDQSTGKSSVLEAIGRFHFPVAGRVCTQFPTKLILRRSSEEHTVVSIQPAPSRTDADRERLEKFREELSRPDEFPALVDRARAELGVPASSNYGAGGSQEPLRFVEDVLVVKSSGPDLVQVDLVDLPGLFTAETQQQDGVGMRIVNDMVRQYIRSRNSLVLLVVSVATSFANQAARAMIQDMAQTDRTLEDRVIGVMTNPDRAVSVEDALDVLNGSLDSTNLRHKWLVVKNQGQQERSNEPLDQRDWREEHFFLNHPEWNRVPRTQCGINALRSTLRVALLQHTQAALPGVIVEVEATVKTLEARLDAGVSRSTPEARQVFLCDIAQKFSDLTREACSGTYQDEQCKALHKVGDECRVCARFFPRLRDDSPASQDRKLRANIRLLSRAFASAMREYGKTEEIVSSSNNSNTSINTNPNRETDHSAHEPHDVAGLLSPDTIAAHYTFPAPGRISHQDLNAWLAARIPQWRGREPQGEASENTYHLLFEHQSEKWPAIAAAHLDAVWQAVQRFVDVALTASCPADDDVRAAIRTHLTQPALADLQRASHRAMLSLIGCHARGRTGFYDGFVDVGPLRRRARGLSARLDRSDDDGTAGGSFAGDMLGFVLSAAGGNAAWAKSSIGVLAGELARGAVLGQLGGALADVFDGTGESAGGAGDGEVGREAYFVLVPRSMDNLAAARAVEHVEMFYEMSMMSFVGYVNSLVVESGILHELPRAILTQHRILREDAAKIELIAGEKASDARKRERDQADLDTLKRVLETLKGFSG
ncbi:P-loop containing nucleoside triphosphate hydrolase protein [Lasiosphaeria ovina]|uniref:P-loop containing nucleoside triphosphate hydrolase protein n=1 Tax=Lasiosphaeria ovina TaxID=92902 RepID=A0AAE0NBK8_9PEZI|nr:P-loop containing nucleoside triphosphate hydrolase protein [Lasiosphaeria ovina]